MTISIQQIISQLDLMHMEYRWVGSQEDKTLLVASLFEPVDGGFYFFNGSGAFHLQVKDSVLLVPEDFDDANNTHQNVLVKLKGDTQRIYYLLLSNLFSRKSTGRIAPTAVIHPEAKIGLNVQIDDFCVVEACTIGDEVIIESHSKIHENVVIGAHTIIGSMSVIGSQGVAWVWNQDQSARIVQPQLGGVQIGNNCFVGANTIVVRGSLNEATRIGENTLMAPGGRIGHGTQIGNFVHFANNVITGGNTHIGDFCFVGSGAVFRPKVKIHPKTIVGAGSV